MPQHLCVSSLRRGHANVLCIVPILTDDPRMKSNVVYRSMISVLAGTPGWHPASSGPGGPTASMQIRALTQARTRYDKDQLLYFFCVLVFVC